MPFDETNTHHVSLMITEMSKALQGLEDAREASDRVTTIIARNGVDFASYTDFPPGFSITPAQMAGGETVISALNTIFVTNITPAIQNKIDDILLNIGKLVGSG